MTRDANHDDELTAHLRSLATLVDPVPDDVILAGRSAIAHRDLDVRLAELVDQELAVGGVRGGTEPWFAFEVDDVLVELAIRTKGKDTTLVGQVDGATPETIVVAQPEAEHVCELDAQGRFRTSVTAGPVRVQMELPGGERIATSWIVAA